MSTSSGRMGLAVLVLWSTSGYIMVTEPWLDFNLKVDVTQMLELPEVSCPRVMEQSCHLCISKGHGSWLLANHVATPGERLTLPSHWPTQRLQRTQGKADLVPVFRQSPWHLPSALYISISHVVPISTALPLD